MIMLVINAYDNMNDVNNTNMSAQYIYKYNLQLNQFVD